MVLWLREKLPSKHMYTCACLHIHTDTLMCRNTYMHTCQTLDFILKILKKA